MTQWWQTATQYTYRFHKFEFFSLLNFLKYKYVLHWRLVKAFFLHVNMGISLQRAHETVYSMLQLIPLAFKCQKRLFTVVRWRKTLLRLWGHQCWTCFSSTNVFRELGKIWMWIFQISFSHPKKCQTKMYPLVMCIQWRVLLQTTLTYDVGWCKTRSRTLAIPIWSLRNPSNCSTTVLNAGDNCSTIDEPKYFF